METLDPKINPATGVKWSDCWRTPETLCNALGTFDTDPCSGEGSHVKASVSYALERNEDGLALPWGGSVFCNMPYSDPMPWCSRLAAHKGPWVALVKLDPSTKWWQVLMGDCTNWAPFRKRITFDPPAGIDMHASAKFPNALVWKYYEPSVELQNMLWMPEIY